MKPQITYSMHVPDKIIYRGHVTVLMHTQYNEYHYIDTVMYFIN